MAKHCDVCNQEYPDDLPACPHCAMAKKTHLAGGPAEDRKTQLAGGPAEDRKTQLADIDPTEAAPPEEAGASVPAEMHEEIVGELHVEETLPPASSSSDAEADVIDLTAAPPEPVESHSDSAVDLGAPPVEIVEEDSGAILEEAPPSGSSVFMAELASDASHVDLVGGSGVNLVEGDTKSPSDRDLIAEAVEAGIDHGTPAAELTETASFDAALFEEHSSAVDLGSPAAPPSDEPISAEEVAEAADESGINLGSANTLTSPSAGDSNLVLESLLSESPSGAASAEEEAAVVEEDAVAAEADVDDLLANLGRETTAGAEGLEAIAEEEEIVAGEEAVVAAEGAVAADAEGEQAAVSEAEVDDLLAGLEQETVTGDGALAARADEEVVGEAAEEEEPVAAAEEEVEKPAKPVKQRSRVPALAGGTFLGLLLGAGGLIGARFGGVDVPAMIGVGEKKPSGPVVPQVKAPTFEERAAHVRNGDWDQAGVEQIQEDKPEELVVRGENRLGAYLQKSGAKVNLQDPPLQQAIADLQKAAEAKNIDAIYDLGLINELANKLPEARAEYTKGVAAAGADPIQKRRFESALDRLDLKASGNPVPAALLLPERVEDRVALLALLLIGLQQPQPAPQPQPPPAPQPQPPPQAGGEEAGFDFWQAAKLARAGDLDKAIEAIRKARKLHDTRRFTRLRKAQNPLSDPTEEIFLRCCNELEQGWLLQKQLRPKYLTDKNTPAQAVQLLLKEASDSAATVEKVRNKLVEEKIIKPDEDVPAGVESLITNKKKADKDVVDLTAKLDKTTKDAADLTAKLKTAEETIKDRDTKLAASVAREQKLKADNDGLTTTLKKIADELTAAKLLDPKGKADVGEAVRKAVDIAKMKDPAGTIRQQRSEIALLTVSLKERWRPEEMMPLWLLMLDQNRGRPELTSQAKRDVERVKNDPKATPVQKGQAEVVLGLTLRNTEKFTEAKTVLETARTTVDKGEWLLSADAALKEVSDPTAYYAGQAERLYDRSQIDAALAVLDQALKVLPEKDHGRLFAQRSLIELDAARSKAKGPLPAKEPLVVAAQKDAAAAVKAGLAEGHYAEGRIAEELGQLDAAIASYRKALAAHPALDADGSRYRVSLARVLLQPREARPGQLPPPAAAEKVGWRDPAPYPARAWQEMKVFTLMVLLGLQAPPLPGEEPNLEEAEKLADEILKAPANTVPFNLRAQALAIKGRWTLALQTYVAGVRPLMPREYGNGLAYLILNHPRLKRPDSLLVPNPLEAEKHFAAGLNFYFDRDYSNAEKEFLLTVENDSQDARYFYYLGLSRLAQSKRRDAFADFDEGAMLERLNRPASAAVSESLERIQGPVRRIVNEVRTRPLER